MFQIYPFRLARMAVLFFCSMYAGMALSSDNITENSKKSKLFIPPLTNEQLFLERKALENVIEENSFEKRLNDEQQKYSEQRLMDVVGTQELQFKSTIANIYSQNDYVLLWEDNKAEKQFLREYAAFVASGLSKQSARNLNRINEFADRDPLLYDILLTDAFLDYLYYSQYILKSAQQWLYSPSSYKSNQPSEESIQHWLNAVKKNENFSFIVKLEGKNSLYRQTLYQLEALASLGDIDRKQFYKLAINLQRLRILPEFNNGIFVNIPSYQLNYYRNGQLIINSRVIVGKQSRKTPVMYSKLSNVVVNPPWTPTTKLINEDIVPKIKRDPDYVQRHGYTILDGKGQPIDSHSINWSEIGNRFPYAIRQAPGDSALGNYKFNMPSADAIYLHDTPNHNLFSKKQRALSSGCIRVEESDKLASILLKEVGWSDTKRANVLKSKKTTSAKIISDNPVYLYYVTAWMDNGKFYTLPDIYGYDAIPDLSYIDWKIIRKYLMQ